MEPIPWKVMMWVGVGGALGAASRAWAVAWISHKLGPQWPWGTLLVNLSGSLTLGLLAGLVSSRGLLGPQGAALWMTGFLGALTTFSTFSLEAIKLWRGGEGAWVAAAYVLSSVVGGLALAALGWALGHAGQR